MRIAIVGNFGLGYKGTMAARALPIAAELAARGHQVAAFLPADSTDSSNSPSSSPVQLVRAGPVRGNATLPRAIGHLWLGLRLTWLTLRFRPDVLYAFKPKGYAGLALLVFWLLRRAGLTRAILALDADDWEGVGGWSDWEERPAWLAGLVTWHERWCLRHADVVTVASRALARLVTRECATCVYAPNAASPASPGWELGQRDGGRRALGLGDAPVVLSYTRFVEFAPGRLVDTFAQIRAAVPEARLLVAGKGLGDEDATLARLAGERGLDGAICQLGWTDRHDLPDVFAAADVALYPLDDTVLNRAKCPMKLVDLLLAGVPVVADDVGQAPEYVADGQTGRLVSPVDVAAMAGAAVDLLRDPARRQALGHAARASLLTHRTWARQADAIEEALIRSAGGRASPPRPLSNAVGEGEE
jgi:glycosyltransferase involved in cell wall biosynthesis